MKTRITWLNKYIGILLIALTIMVTIPLVVKTLQAGDGTWGFAIVGMPILLPLCAYFLFGVAACITEPGRRKRWFVVSHIVTLLIGGFTLVVFPVYPMWFVAIPLLLAYLGIRSQENFDYYNLVMMVLAVIANLLLLKWEIDFDRTVPLFQLFT